jgi:hypothetical protein
MFSPPLDGNGDLVLSSGPVGKTSRALARVIAVLVGVPASFVAGAAVFADGAPILSAERIVPVAATYVVVGAIFSFFCRLIWQTIPWWHWGILVSLPAVFVVGLLGKDIGPGYQAVYVMVALVSASSGAFIGALPADALKHR